MIQNVLIYQLYTVHKSGVEESSIIDIFKSQGVSVKDINKILDNIDLCENGNMMSLDDIDEIMREELAPILSFGEDIDIEEILDDFDDGCDEAYIICKLYLDSRSIVEDCGCEEDDYEEYDESEYE